MVILSVVKLVKMVDLELPSKALAARHETSSALKEGKQAEGK